MTSAPHVMAGPEFLAVFAIAFALGLVVGAFALRAWQLSCRRGRPFGIREADRVLKQEAARLPRPWIATRGLVGSVEVSPYEPEWKVSYRPDGGGAR